MSEPSSIIVGLEVGTSKVCAVVGECTGPGALNIIGVGQCPSQGVRKGEITDADQAESDIRTALSNAEEMANVEIHSVYLGVTGSHIRGFTNRGMHPIVSADREITEEDVQDVIKNARTINLPAHNHVIHAIRQHFLVDGHDGITNPVGMLGSRLEVDMHVIHGNFNRLQNAVRVVKNLHLEVDEIVFNGLATSLAVLGRDQKEMGALVVDMGGGTTDYVVYADGIIRHTGVLAVGGDHLSNDLAIGLKVPLGRAEQLKLEHGAALVDESVRDKTIDITNDLGMRLKTLRLDNLRRIMSLRLEETFELVRRDVEEAGMYEFLRAGVYLCGGCARIPQVAALAEKVFELPVFLGRCENMSGSKSALDQPEFATGIGLVKFGASRRTPQPPKPFLREVAETFRHILGRR